ncbi:MAG: lactate racemase domain-containing protein [Syntrophothermus sp.]
MELPQKMELPQMHLCRQNFPRVNVAEPAKTLTSLLASSWVPEKVKPGDKVAITGGSRGIAAMVPLARALVSYLRQLGAQPFVVNAMGSHGGGTAEGQKEMLTALGMTEGNLGCPIVVSMEVEQIGELADGFPVLCDRNAWQADHIVVINRVKLHTAVRGPVQSGLCKMITVGLGKERQAARLHRYGPAEMGRLIQETASVTLRKAPVLAGVAIVENAYGEVARLELVRPEDFLAADARLLKEAAKLQPALPIRELDLLVVEELGKTYSGAGLDTHVIGRWRIWGEPEPEWPRIQRIVALRLAASSHGNAQGMGLADFITEKFYHSIDFEVTYKNTLTSTFVQRGMIPIVAANDREAINEAVSSLLQVREDRLRIAWIKNTLHLEIIALSPAALAECADASTVTGAPVVEKLRAADWRFDADGNLLPWEE